MLEKPDLADELIVRCLDAEFGLRAAEIAFLPLGADRNTAVYRVAADGRTFFCKLRGGVFDETSVTLPRYLSEQGIAQIIAPLTGRSGQLWGSLGAYKVILYPFVAGRDGYEQALSAEQWRAYGAALRRIHSLALPAALAGRIRREDFSGHWRATARGLVERAAVETHADPVSAGTAALLREQRAVILDLVGRAERLAAKLKKRPGERVLCHSDLHAGNFLLAADGAFFIVDWDDPILAPRERDLMFVGGGQVASWLGPEDEERLFYGGYGPGPVDQEALAYYRYERIVVDIAAFCEQILLPGSGDEDREQSLRYLASNFDSGGVLEIAERMERTGGVGR